MTEQHIEIFGVQFDPDAVIVSYMVVPDDVRVDGMVGIQHQIRLDRGHPDYGDDAVGLIHRVQRMVANALQDFRNSEPVDPADDEDDDEVGMGDGR